VAGFTVSLVGYTNAGKSTLFNTLTHAGAIAEDRLFATLDTTTRRLYLPRRGTWQSPIRWLIRDLPTPWSRLPGDPRRGDTPGPPGAPWPMRRAMPRAQIVESTSSAEIGASAVPRLLVLNKIYRNGLSRGVDRANMIESARSSKAQNAAAAWMVCAVPDRGGSLEDISGGPAKFDGRTAPSGRSLGAAGAGFVCAEPGILMH